MRGVTGPRVRAGEGVLPCGMAGHIQLHWQHRNFRARPSTQEQLDKPLVPHDRNATGLGSSHDARWLECWLRKPRSTHVAWTLPHWPARTCESVISLLLVPDRSTCCEFDSSLDTVSLVPVVLESLVVRPRERSCVLDASRLFVVSRFSALSL